MPSVFLKGGGTALGLSGRKNNLGIYKIDIGKSLPRVEERRRSKGPVGRGDREKDALVNSRVPCVSSLFASNWPDCLVLLLLASPDCLGTKGGRGSGHACVNPGQVRGVASQAEIINQKAKNVTVRARAAN